MISSLRVEKTMVLWAYGQWEEKFHVLSRDHRVSVALADIPNQVAGPPRFRKVAFLSYSRMSRTETCGRGPVG